MGDVKIILRATAVLRRKQICTSKYFVVLLVLMSVVADCSASVKYPELE